MMIKISFKICSYRCTIFKADDVYTKVIDVLYIKKYMKNIFNFIGVEKVKKLKY